MKEDKIVYLSFTEKGRVLAERLCAAFGGEVSCTRDGARVHEWTAAHFSHVRALVYVGAVGIAVRAVAPHLVSKASDPAVIAVDEGAHFVVPLAAGHLGGANALSREIAAAVGATAVVTTATDVSGVFAVDEWARVQGCAVSDVRAIHTVSSRLLAGELVTVASAFPVRGDAPEGLVLRNDPDADVWVDVRVHGGALTVVPRALVLGLGCRRGTEKAALEARFAELCSLRGIIPEAICCAATIDLKKDEKGLLAFCEAHGWDLRFYSAWELAQTEGEFASSSFVNTVTGVDNVCERSAVRAAGEGGSLLVHRYAGGGMTMALAKRPVDLDWRWQNG